MQGQFDNLGFIVCPADDTPQHLESRTSYFFIVIRLTTPVSFFLRKQTSLCGEISIYNASEKLSTHQSSDPCFQTIHGTLFARNLNPLSSPCPDFC